MKNKFKISIFIITSFVIVTDTTPANGTIVNCQEESSWSKMTAKLTAFFYGKKAAEKSAAKKNKKKTTQETIKENKPVKLSRGQATEEIRKITSKLFDPKDLHHISLHLNEMKEFTKFLDEIEDKKLIAAIHFLLENHHKSSIIYLAFWIQASKELEFDTIIPMTPHLAKMPKAEKLAILRKKMTISA